jgi:short-subunit dehydrogenase
MAACALITGASSGIGVELARLFASDGWNVALVARDEAKLCALADELKGLHKIEARVCRTDLAVPNAARNLFESLNEIEISALVNNAGFGCYGYFAEVPLETHRQLVQVNIQALIDLTHFFLPAMVIRKRGMILNVGSVAAFQPGPTMNVYYASKAFVYSFSQALATELEGSGVTVTVLNPGTTRTRFFDRAGVHMKRPFPLMDAREVAMAGYRAALRGRRSVTPGLMNQLISLFSPCLPSRLTASIVAKIHES